MIFYSTRAFLLFGLLCFLAHPGVAASVNWQTVSAGSEHTCGLRDDGSAWCWGWGSAGERGDGSTIGQQATPAPVRVTGLSGSKWTGIAAGISLTCGIRDDGSAWCWGSGTDGQRGDGSTAATQPLPTRISTRNLSGSRWRAITVNAGHACGLRDDGSAWCWGDNEAGALGTGSDDSQATPAHVSDGPLPHGEWTALAAGSGFTCGLRDDGGAWCWGRNGYVGSTQDDPAVPFEINAGGVSGTKWTALAAGADSACGLRDDGSAWCWGNGALGQLGNGHSTSSAVPVQVIEDGLSGRHWVALSLSDSHSCALRDDGSAWCWGAGAFGQLGSGGTPTAQKKPVSVNTKTATGSKWASVSAGSEHSCGVRNDGSAWCWGYGYDGELGDGVSDFVKIVPVQVQ